MAIKIMFAVFLCVCLVSSTVIRDVVPKADLQYRVTKQEDQPSIEYKYVMKAILPLESHWWKRGTHHFYADIPSNELAKAA